MTDESEDIPFRISADVGGVHLTVKGSDPEWVDETFDEKLESVIREVKRAEKDDSRGYL